MLLEYFGLHDEAKKYDGVEVAIGYGVVKRI
jgi:hypothetical protein